MGNILLVQKAIHSSRETREKGMVINSDTENNFDRVRYNFIFATLPKFGFGMDMHA